MSESLKNKNVLVTGASQGLGAVIAKVFATAGCHVYVNCARGVENAQTVVDEIVASGGSAEFFQCDISDEQDISLKFQSLKSIDILVNNARINPYSRPPGSSEAEWFAQVFKVNLTGPHLVTLALIEGMKKRHWGRIINISSIQGHIPVPRHMIPYGVAKAGLNELTRCFALEAAPYNVTVNTVSPGMIVTENISKNLTSDEIEERNQRIPLHRGATPEEIAEAVLFVAECGYMTGEIVNVNGGLWMTP